MRGLYEVENGFIGESYTRCYVWAGSEAEALALAQGRFKADAAALVAAGDDLAEFWEKLVIRRLFTADAAPFVTQVSSSGWLAPKA